MIKSIVLKPIIYSFYKKTCATASEAGRQVPDLLHQRYDRGPERRRDDPQEHHRKPRLHIVLCHRKYSPLGGGGRFIELF